MKKPRMSAAEYAVIREASKKTAEARAYAVNAMRLTGATYRQIGKFIGVTPNRALLLSNRGARVARVIERDFGHPCG